MNPALTISTLSFNQQFSESSGSLRREVSRGLNLQERMSVKHQEYTDSATKRRGKQSAVIFEYDKALTDGTIVPAVRATLKVQSLTDSAVGSSEVLAVLARVQCLIGTGGSNLNLGGDIFVDGAQ